MHHSLRISQEPAPRANARQRHAESESLAPSTQQVAVSRRLAFINAVSSMAARLLNVSALVWMYDYLLARLSPEEFALYPVVSAVLVFAPVFFAILTGGFSRHITEACAQGDRRQVTENVSSILPPLALASCAFMLLGALVVWRIDDVLRIPPERLWEARLMLALLLFNFTCQTLLTPYGVGFQVKQRFVLLNVIQTGRDLLRILALFLLLVGLSPRVLWVVVATVATNLLGILVTTWWSRRMIPDLRFDRRLFRWGTTKRLMSFGAWTTAGMLSNMIYNSAGVIVLNKFATALDVTTYHLGSMFDRQTSAFSTLAVATAQPALVALHASGERRRLGNAFLCGGRYALWATLFVGMPLMVFSSELIGLYVGDAFQKSATVIALLMAMAPFTCSSIMVLNLSMATARVRPYFAGVITTQLVHLAVMIYLVRWRHMGAVGVAVATLSTMALSQVFYFWPMGLQLAEISLKRFGRETLLPGLLPAAAGLVVWLPLERYDAITTWSALCGYTLCGAVVYICVLIKFSLQRQEKRELFSSMRRAQRMFIRG